MNRAVARTVFALVVAAAGLAAQSPPAGVTPAASPPALATIWPPARLDEALLPRAGWVPVPSIADRAAWDRLSPRLSARITAEGERALATPVPPLPATLFLEYARNGNRTRFEASMFARRDRLHVLVLAECLEDRGRFLDAIVDTAWAIAEESSWTVPAHQGAQKAGTGLPDTAEPIVDLFSAQTAHSMAWTLYLLGDRLDRVSPLARPRLLREVSRRVLDPYLAREDFGWMGFAPLSRRPNNWNPWINSNIIAAALLVEPDDARRVALLHKALRSLDRYLGPHPPDGGCDEGPNYWGRAGASLFEALELLHSASGGRLSVFDDAVVANMGRYIYRVQIAGPWMVNVGDSSPRVGPDAALAFRYGRAIGDAQLTAFGAAGASDETIPLDDRSIGRTLLALFGWSAMAAQPDAAPPLPRDAWFPSEDLQLMVARDRGGSTDGYFVAAWGSHNDQSHNHNDVGNIVVFIDGTPVLVDAGRPTYTARTFSNRRYEIWAMQSAYHNVPTVRGTMQQAGRAFAARDVAYASTDAAAELRMNIAPAYPGAAGIASWTRTAKLSRGSGVSVVDSVVLNAPADDVRLSFMTPCEAVAEQPGRLRLSCARGSAGPPVRAALAFPSRSLAAGIERVDLDDPAMTRVWGDHLTRIVLRTVAPVQNATWTVTVTKEP